MIEDISKMDTLTFSIQMQDQVHQQWSETELRKQTRNEQWNKID